ANASRSESPKSPASAPDAFAKGTTRPAGPQTPSTASLTAFAFSWDGAGPGCHGVPSGLRGATCAPITQTSNLAGIMLPPHAVVATATAVGSGKSARLVPENLAS